MKGLIPFLSFKGGVGKSTICAMCQEATEDSVILNIDLAQYAEDINYGATIDLSDILSGNKTEEEIETSPVIDTVNQLLSNFGTVFVDTPGEQTQELIEMLQEFKERIDTIIVPILPGRRTISATINSIYFLYKTELLKKGLNIVFVINRYNKDSIEKETEESIKEELKENDLENIFNIFFTKLKNSDAIITMENSKSSIEDLKATNFVAYKTFSIRVHDLIKDINHALGE